MRSRFFSLLLVGATLTAGAADTAKVVPKEAPAAVPDSRAVMTGEQVVQILDETVDWYRTLGSQQQAATQPSDLLILYANRQTADKVMALAFEIARANAELLSSEASAAQASSEADGSQSLSGMQKKLAEQRAAIQADIEATRRELAAAPPQGKADLQTRIAVMQGELDMINARRNLLANMAQFANESTGANTLKAHIDAIAASIPSASATATPVDAGTGATAASQTPSSFGSAVSASLSQFGIWDLSATVLRLSAKSQTIETVDRRTAQLQELFTKVRTPPMEQLSVLTARGDALAAKAESANGEGLRDMRDQYDTLAWLFAQTSAMLTPLSKAGVLLTQYRHNLGNWRDATDKQYHEALKTLGLRLAVFVGLLVAVFAAAELWKRAVLRYVSEVRRQSRFLLLRKIVLWSLVVAITAATFATQLSSLATFAGLITAGLAVAMQSVLVSVVGYFFLIGKYGIRVGDRVQIGNVTGEVIELGLVRLHLMELSSQGPIGPTGRVVAFANSIIFQASSGLFKQIPGVNLSWHDITLKLPDGCDYAALKDKLTAAVIHVLQDYREDLARQTREIQRTASFSDFGDAQPQVQLRFSSSGVEALVRYPVQLSNAAEIDERVSREVHDVISTQASGTARLQSLGHTQS